MMLMSSSQSVECQTSTPHDSKVGDVPPSCNLLQMLSFCGLCREETMLSETGSMLQNVASSRLHFEVKFRSD